MTRTPVISLGAGVQSSAMLLMAARGELGPVPELALFADTQWEPPEVYVWLDQLEREVAGRIEIVRVTAGSLRDETARFASGEGSRYASPPLYVERPGGGQSILRRQCTKDYKLTPIWRELRRRGFGPKRPVVQWLGISTDEIQRMKPSRKVWASVTWPLIDAGLSRVDCLRWMADKGYPAPRKSACIGCPFHDDRTWRTMKRDHPAEFADAVEWDRQIRHLPRLDSPAFVHRSLVPLDEVDFSSREDRGQLTLQEMDECEAGCFT